jgi:hydrogenase/urease accessory protein HupE
MKTLVAIVMLFASAAALRAHPIAQGAIDVALSHDKITLETRVSSEEIFVANTFGGSPASSLDVAFERHADYLLQHLRLFADERQLAGRLVNFTPPRAGSSSARAVYVLDFSLATPARALRLDENVLNEFEFAPGNRWEATYVVRVKDGAQLLLDNALLTSKAPLNFSSDSRPNAWRTVRDYIRHGVTHILTGYDHLLFIGALALAVTTFWELFKVIAAFTLAHTITLTLSVLNIVRLPSHIVEPMIAASIVVVALQNVLWPARSRGALRVTVAFFFGLFHGLGFAGGLLDAMQGMQVVAIGTAIIAFSIGVEIGHQAVVLPVFGLTRLIGPSRTVNGVGNELLLRLGSAVICCAGMFYFVAAVTQRSS